ncbi:uncharacterized protein [Miscanthus floridulus]|uniref:uncharacterized protein n=1 Tax=Miscanthus floridulus TaxID=154761 RepID=UPI00345A6E54
MGWAHPAVAMEEVLGLVRGFVDVLVLAGGRTSSGAAATWSADEVKKALRWALFFEEILTCMTRASTRILQESSMRHSLSSLQVPSSPRVLLLYVQKCFPWQGCWLCDIS